MMLVYTSTDASWSTWHWSTNSLTVFACHELQDVRVAPFERENKPMAVRFFSFSRHIRSALPCERAASERRNRPVDARFA